jgi:Calcium binding
MHQGERKPGPRASREPEGRARLIALIDEATVDAHDESEQAVGLYTMICESLAVPFKAKVLGRAVNVVEIELGDDNRILAICEAGGSQQRIGLLELPLPSKRPAGAEWIDAYRLWRCAD